MSLSEKVKAYLIGGFSLGAILLLLQWVGEIILPFVFALFVAYLLNPLILKIQTKIKNRNLAITSFFFGTTLLVVGTIFFLAGHITNDAKRFVTAVEIFEDENEQQIKDIKNSVVSFVDNVYKSETVQNKIAATDTLSNDSISKGLLTAFENIYSFFEDSNPKKDESKKKPWNWFFMLIYTALYSVVILYTYDYFEEKQNKYFEKNKRNNDKLDGVWQDFKTVFLKYFRQRTKVVMISICIFILAFSLMDLPGAIIIGIIAGILTYAAHFHYFSLPLVGIGCWMLSIENNTNFFLFFGIVLAVYVLISLLEETVFFNKIMQSVSGMNPAITILSFVLWIYLFGGFTGTIIALPLTQLILIYIDRIMLFSKEKTKEL